MSSKNSFVERPIFVFLMAAVGFFLLSFIAMGIAPWLTFVPLMKDQDVLENPYKDADGQLTSVGRGRQIYIQEGCWHCHSQFVRPAAGEPFRYGPPSKFWESLFDIPQTYGTRRIGPDLAREAGRRTDDWHLAHIYNPRIVVPVSVMPSYPWLFETDKTPKQAALDLVAYLQQLGHAYAEEVRDIVYPKVVKIVGPVKHQYAAEERGAELFRENCSGCHGAQGNGDSAANAFLKPSAVDLTTRYMAATEVIATLNSGVRGTAMPSFHEMPEKDLWALSIYVRGLGAAVKKARPDPKANAALVKKGKGIYESYCVSCHGAAGTPPEELSAAMQPAPRIFSKRIFTDEAVFKIVSEGRTGSGMPPFANLDRDATNALNAYMMTLFEEDPE